LAHCWHNLWQQGFEFIGIFINLEHRLQIRLPLTVVTNF
jgi:hypothetical protein